MSINILKSISIIFIILLANTGLYSEPTMPIMPLAEVKPGMRGTCHTVFTGDELEEFQVEVLEIIKNFYPKRDVILVRLHGDRIEETGVASGMSGSPVYINGKLIGALAFRLGIFSKEPIGGVMPIEDMLQIVEREKYRNEEVEANAVDFSGFSYVEAALGRRSEEAWQKVVETARNLISTPALNQWQQIECPLVFSGFDQRVVAIFSPLFTSLGFKPVVGTGIGSIANQHNDNSKIVPGSAVSGVIVHGDMAINGTGTVTWRDGDHILAFGHPFFNLGPLNIPLASTRILATPPNLMATEKMPQAMAIVGSVLQDRLSGIYGTIGTTAPTVPVTVRYSSPWQKEQTFHFDYTADNNLKVLAPLFVNITVINAIVSAQLSGGASSINLAADIYLKNGQKLELNNFYSNADRPGLLNPLGNIASASSDVALTLGALTVNNFQAPGIEKVELNFKMIPGQKIATIRNIWYDKTKIEPGDKVDLTILLQPVGMPEQRIYKTLSLPEDLIGSRLSILVASGNILDLLEVRTSPQRFIPQNFDQLLRILAKQRKNNILYIQVRGYDSGVLVQGQELVSLPESVMAIMNSRHTADQRSRLSERVILELKIPLDYEVYGSKAGFVAIDQKQKKH